jgi:hypothetical protein
MNDDFPKLTIERHELGVISAVSDHMARSVKVEQWRDVMLRQMQYSMTAYVARNRVWQEEKKTTEPATWWDSWKTHAPAWFRHWLPIRERVVSQITMIYHVCPHLAVDEDKYHLRHMWTPDVPTALMR